MISEPLGEVRSLLFVPACDSEAILAALGSPADAVVIDLEDLTPPERKDGARRELPGVVSAPRPAGAIAVRINSESEEMRAADLELVARLPVDYLLVPKASPALLAELGELDWPLVAIVETAQGLRDAYEIASAPGVAAVALGANDLAADIGLGWPLAHGALAYARSKVIFDAAAAGLCAPFDRVTPSASDPEVVRADAVAACELGFGGKSCTRTRDAELINRVFAETRSPLAGASS